MTPEDSCKLVQLLHFRLRTLPEKARHAHPLVEFTDALTTAYKRGELAPHPIASVHLLSIYKEVKQFDKGHELWSWLTKQSDDYLDARVYGAALELLAYSGKMSLQELEDLYQHALEEHSGTFASYHMSPNAVLPDRSQYITLDGMPMTLLQGIITARLLYGDWLNAYMALDTALRLYPTGLPPRIFEVFCYERPLAESYKVFHMACRSLVVFQPKLVTSLLNKILDTNTNNRLTATRLLDNERILDRVFAAVKAYVGAGGQLREEYLSLMVRAIANLVIWIPSTAEAEREVIERYEEWNSRLTRLAESLVESLAPWLGLDVASAYNSLMVMAGKAKDTSMAWRAFNGITESGAALTAVSYRCLLGAAGLCGNLEHVKAIWEALKAFRQERGGELEFADWEVLAKAAGNTRDSTAPAFVDEERQHANVSESLIPAARSRNAASSPRQWTETLDASLESLNYDEIQEKVVDLVTKTILALNGSRDNGHDFYKEPLITDLHPNPGFGIPRDELRVIYDEMTTDAQQHQPGSAASPAVDAAGYPLDEHRFEHWMSINELLALGKTHSVEKERAVNEAIANGKPMGNVQEAPLPLADPAQASGPGTVTRHETDEDVVLEDIQLDSFTVRKYIRHLRDLQ